MFASHITKKCNRFVSFDPQPDTEAVDAFTIPWENNFFAFPPFSLVPRVLNKIENENVKGIIVVPFWPSQPWYPKFKKLCHSNILFLGPNKNLLTCPYTNSSHPLSQTLRLAVAIL